MKRPDKPCYESAEDVMSRLAVDSGYQRQKAAHQQRQDQRTAELAEAGRSMIDELRAAGIPFSDFNYPIRVDTPPEHVRLAVPVFTKWLRESPSTELRRLLAHYLGTEVSGPLAVDAAIELLGSETDPLVRERLADVVGRFARRDHLADVRRLFNDERLGTARTYLPAALARIGGPDVAADLISALDSTDTRRNSIVTLGKLRPAEALPHLRRFWDDPDRGVRREARKALRSIAAGDAGATPMD